MPNSRSLIPLGPGVVGGPLPETPESLVDPVKRIVVEGCYHLSSQGTVKVSWALERNFVEPGPYKFELFRGRAVNDDNYAKLAEVVDQPWIYDRKPKPRPHEYSTYYKIRITDGNGVQYWSAPERFDVVWNHLDWRLMKEIIRKEMLVLGWRNGKSRVRGAGTQGWLLKTRQFGDPCPRCLDTNTGSPTDSNCPVCYGRGFVGGFYPALEYWVIQQPGLRSTKLSETGETRTTVIESARGLAHPSPEAKDVWVSSVGGKRYEIQGDIEKLVRFRGVDVVLGLRMLELPTTSGAYLYPVIFDGVLNA